MWKLQDSLSMKTLKFTENKATNVTWGLLLQIKQELYRNLGDYVLTLVSMTAANLHKNNGMKHDKLNVYEGFHKSGSHILPLL